MLDWFMKVVRNYAGFSGRAQRVEYWYYALVYFLISIALEIVDSLIGFGLLGALFALALLVPSLAVGVRRLHDIGRSGWWLLIGLIPVIGWIVLIVFAVQDSQPGDNEYGPNPKGVVA